MLESCLSRRSCAWPRTKAPARSDGVPCREGDLPERNAIAVMHEQDAAGRGGYHIRPTLDRGTVCWAEKANSCGNAS